MLTKDRVDQFYKDVETLGLKRPVAAISEKTGYAKGNVSSILSRKLQPSENFLNKFYGSFKMVPELASRASHDVGAADKPRSDHAAYIKLLEDNDRFFKTEYHNLLLSLNKIMEIGMRSEELIKLNLEHIGNVEALQKGVDPGDVHEQINNQIAGIGDD